MIDERPSILDRWKKRAELPVREPAAEKAAKDLTDRIMARFHGYLDPKNLPAVRVEISAERMTIAVNAAKWFLPTALREFFDFEGKRRELRALKNEVRAEIGIPTSERNEKLRLIERRIAGINQFEMGFDAMMSFGTHNAEIHKDEEEVLEKVSSTFVGLLPFAGEARRYLGLRLFLQNDDGTEREISEELRFG